MLAVEYEDDCQYDSVTVFDGESVTPLATLCGSSVPSPITSSGSSMIVRFTSDDTVTPAGFHVKYTTLAAASSGSASSVAGPTSSDTGPTSSDPGKRFHQLKLYMFG